MKNKSLIIAMLMMLIMMMVGGAAYATDSSVENLEVSLNGSVIGRYSSLYDALKITNQYNGCLITVLNSYNEYDLASSYQIKNETDVTLDLNGNTIEDYGYHTVSEKFEIMDSKGNGKIIMVVDDIDGKGKFFIEHPGHLVLRSGTIEYLNDPASWVIDAATSSGASRSTFTMTGGKIKLAASEESTYFTNAIRAHDRGC